MTAPENGPAPPRSRPARSGTRGSAPGRRPGPRTPASPRSTSGSGRRCGTSGCRPGRRGRPRTAPPSGPGARSTPGPAPHPPDTAPRPRLPGPATGPHRGHRPASRPADSRSAAAPAPRCRRSTAAASRTAWSRWDRTRCARRCPGSAPAPAAPRWARPRHHP